ncbi:hypothetical protein EBZ39_14930 [bacterium]|nr:hypothetical protein [bacterium]
MGWIASVPNSFGSGFIECLEQIVEDNGILLRESFRKILAKTATDWGHIAGSLNGGNESYYNLYRMGSKIDEITERCRNPVFRQGDKGVRPDIDWERILKDVKWVSDIVLFELQNNVVAVDPFNRYVEMVDSPHIPEWRRTREYVKYKSFSNDDCA